MRLPSLFFVLVCFLAVPTQDSPPRQNASAAALNDDQIAVYRAVLQYHFGNSKTKINLADETEPMATPHFHGSCPSEKEMDAPPSPSSVIHSFSKSPALDSRIVIVEPRAQSKVIEKNDPQNLIRGAIDEHKAVTNKQLDESLKRAFDTGLFTFSEIVFDSWHRRALVNYGFTCGMLCGHGATLILKKKSGKWEVTKTCSTWIS